MIIEIRIPSPGESITEVEMANWLVNDGDFVEKDQEVGEVESDKATLPLIAGENGKIKIKVKEGETIKVGEIACEIDTSQVGKPKAKAFEKQVKKDNKKSIKEEGKAVPSIENTKKKEIAEKENIDYEKVKITPVAQKMMKENNLNIDDILNGIKRITALDVKSIIDSGITASSFQQKNHAPRDVERVPMTSLRKKLSERLVSVKNQTAMLTTFNEVNMGSIIDLRKNYQQKFTEKHGIKLGFMSFFTKAVVETLKIFPKVNSQIDGDSIITPSYYDIGIAVQTDKGLMVPILRNAETMSLAEIEIQIADLAKKARAFRLSIDEMSGGTFSITNGGVFGSLLSTPIINPPQSAILGMHNIQERPVAVNGKIEIHPMMYLALSYDHRIIDGKDSVSFLVKVKELLESPQKMMFSGIGPNEILLGL